MESPYPIEADVSPADHEGFDWDELLGCMKEGRVVPVVGRDLLRTEAEGQNVLLYSYLASRLAEEFGVSLPDPDNAALEDVAVRVLCDTGKLNAFCGRLKHVLNQHPFPVPKPLRQLADIDTFQLVVSTTFDSLLAQALARPGEAETPCQTAYDPKRPQDLPEGALTRPFVYQLFGRASVVPGEYALTEEDVVEFLHHLQSETRRPQRLFDRLQRDHVLLLGCGLSGWLARFFIRTLKCTRLTQCTTPGLVADEHVRIDPRLVLFLTQCGTRVYSLGSPIQFIEELHRRWQAARPADSVPVGTGPQCPSSMPKGGIFLSYAREDLDAARSLKQALDDAGLETWMDECDIPPASDWDRDIRANIQRCEIFIACLSRHALAQRKSYFWGEWRDAIKESKGIKFGGRFLWPVTVDDLPPDSEEIPQEFRTVHVASLPGGRPTPEFLAEVEIEIRRIRSAPVFAR